MRSPLTHALVMFALVALAACGGSTPYVKVYESASNVCPDQAPTRLYNPAAGSGSASDSSKTTSNIPWATPCETAIIKKAIDYCNYQVSKTDFFENTGEKLDSASQSLVTLSAAAAGVAGLVVSSPPIAIAGAATLVTSLSTNLGKIISGTPTAASVGSMTTAAQQYAQLNQNLVPPVDTHVKNRKHGRPDQNNPFYAGLWNAVGSACPPTLLAGGFQMAKIEWQVPLQFYNTTTATYPVKAVDTAQTIANAIMTELNNDPTMSFNRDVTVANGPPSSRTTPAACSTLPPAAPPPATIPVMALDITFKPPAQSKYSYVHLSPIVTAASPAAAAPAPAREFVTAEAIPANPYGARLEVAVCPQVQPNDNINISVTWW